MSFHVDKTTKAITVHKGDTGAFWETLYKKSGTEFVQGDVAIFEVLSGDRVIIHREFELQPETPTDICPGNGKFLISFRNSDTDSLKPDTYQTELKVALAPIRSDGKVVDGNTVRTVWQSSLQVRPVYIQV